MPFKRSVSNEFHLEQNMLQLQLLISLQLSTLLLGYCLSPRKTRSKWSLMELLLFVASKERSRKENVFFLKFWWTKEVTCFLDELYERNKKNVMIDELLNFHCVWLETFDHSGMALDFFLLERENQSLVRCCVWLEIHFNIWIWVANQT